MTIALTLVATAAAAWTAVAAVAPHQFGKDRRRLIRALAPAKAGRPAGPARSLPTDSRFAGYPGYERPVLLR